jgi:hypothetical protein
MARIPQRADRTSDARESSGALPAPSGALRQRQAMLPWIPLDALPPALPAQRVLWAMSMQRTLGNRATAELLEAETKLAVSDPGDALEVEADQVAERVMRMAEPAAAWKPGDADEREADEVADKAMWMAESGVTRSAPAEVQRSTPGAHSPAPKPVLQRAETAPPINPCLIPPTILSDASTWQPLDARTRAYFEPRFGHDFGGVRVHTDERADISARKLNAFAYTAGQDVVFHRGTFSPETTEGKRLLAHELAHVVQQERGANLSVQAQRAEPAGGSAEREADRAADAIIRGEPIPALSPTAGALQCQRAPNDQDNASTNLPPPPERSPKNGTRQLHGECYARVFDMPESFEEFETMLKNWMARCVTSRTVNRRTGTAFHRERPLVER